LRDVAAASSADFLWNPFGIKMAPRIRATRRTTEMTAMYSRVVFSVGIRDVT
jgi:hypothetical protein